MPADRPRLIGGRVYQRGRCRCGWVGPKRMTVAMAEQDRQDHARKCRSATPDEESLKS